MEEVMKRSTMVTGVLAVMLLAMAVAPAAAQNIIDKISAHEDGYRETPLTINSNGTADFTATISQDGTSITYTETYQDLSSTVTQSHIHFGRPAITGGIVLFLCTNLAPPAGVPTPQRCLAAPATITGTLTAADVIALPDQGIDSGAAGFAEMIRAIRARAAYVNVHTVNHPGGEVRGRLDEPND
jgi:hypothetical protein